MEPTPENPYVKPPPPVRPPQLDSDMGRSPQPCVAGHPSEVEDRDRARASRNSPVGETKGSYASVVRGTPGSNYTRPDWIDNKKSSKSEWGDKKSNWNARGWSETRRYREEGRRQ